MMGLPAGHVTGHGLRPAQELKMLGNGVVPQQAALALRMLGLGGDAVAVGAAGELLPTPVSMPGASDLDFQVSGDGRTKPNKLGWAVGEMTS